jgi:hypothetical protein
MTESPRNCKFDVCRTVGPLVIIRTATEDERPCADFQRSSSAAFAEDAFALVKIQDRRRRAPAAEFRCLLRTLTEVRILQLGDSGMEEAAVENDLRQRGCQQGLACAGSALQQDCPRTIQFAIEKQIDLLHPFELLRLAQRDSCGEQAVTNRTYDERS